MKQGLELSQLAQEVQRQDTLKRDFIVPTQHMKYTGGQLYIESQKSIDAFQTDGYFEGQMATSLGIPTKYFRLMQNEAPELLEDNVNHWLQASDNRHLVRTLDGSARAWLSKKYNIVDHAQILETVLPPLLDDKSWKVESCNITPTSLYLKVVNERVEGDVEVGDTVQGGLIITNSEVGAGSIAIRPLLYRLVCTNGMVVNSLAKRQFHLGTGYADEQWEIFQDDTVEADKRAFDLKLRDTLTEAMKMIWFGQALNTLKKSKELVMVKGVPDVVEVVRKKFQYTKQTSDSILNQLIREGDLTAYGLGNAITRVAQDQKSYDTSTLMEAQGFEVVNLEPNQWEAIAGRA
jgi:hypothetical protein